jgi:opacity protein-like surface antigen
VTSGSLYAKSHSYHHSYKDALLVGNDNTGFVGIGGGASWLGLSSSSTSVTNGVDPLFAPPPMTRDSYSINSTEAAGVAQFVAGYRWHQAQNYLPYSHLFFQYRHYFNSTVHGKVDQYSLPEFQNYQYNLAYSADLFTLNGKLDLLQWRGLLPYISGGFGVIVNHVTGYSETPTPNVTPRISPNYADRSNSRFAGTLGTGFDFILAKNTWITLGYEHVFQAGTLKTGGGATTWSNTALNLGKPKLDTLFLSVSVNFPQLS